MYLSATAIKAAKSRDKPYKLYDGRGLYLLVNPGGSRLWRFRYQLAGREKLLALGLYPDVELAQARERRDSARKLIAAGIDPSAQRQAEKQAGANTFAAVVDEWLAHLAHKVEPATLKRTSDRMAFVTRAVGRRRASDLLARDFLPVLRSIESRGRIDTAHRTRAEISRVMCFAVATGRADRDPIPDLREALTPHRVKHFAGITEPKKTGELLRAIDGYQGQPTTEFALKLSPYLFVRPVELRSATWQQIDFDAAEWRVPAARMKSREPHIVPLARQVLKLLESLSMHTGDGELLFPSLKSPLRPISANTVNAALRRMGYPRSEMTGHGFRTTASTLLTEQGFASDVIELQLAHLDDNKTRAAYNRAKRLPERRAMMQVWADYLDALRSGAKAVNPLRLAKSRARPGRSEAVRAIRSSRG